MSVLVIFLVLRGTAKSASVGNYIQPPFQVILVLTLGGNLDTGSKEEVVQELYFLALSPWLAQPGFLHNPGPSALGGPTHSGLGPPTSAINQENVSTD